MAEASQNKNEQKRAKTSHTGYPTRRREKENALAAMRDAYKKAHELET
jgi:hypothetical protein